MDGEGKIRIGKTLIDGLSEGEQMELAFRVAKAQAAEYLEWVISNYYDKLIPRKSLETALDFVDLKADDFADPSEELNEDEIEGNCLVALLNDVIHLEVLTILQMKNQ